MRAVRTRADPAGWNRHNHNHEEKKVNARSDYADIELPGTAKAKDFDVATIAIVTSIVLFKLLMLSVLIVAF
jgi:hypothetical protein